MVDAVKRTIDHLAAALSVPVYGAVPTTRDPEFVHVWRTGGPLTGRVLDQPQLTITCWSTSRGKSSDLALSARAALLDAARATGAGFHRVNVSSLYYDPDPVSDTDRHTLLVFLTVRA